MLTRSYRITGGMLGSVIIAGAILAFLFTVGGETRCAQAQASCAVGDDETFAGDLVLQSGTAFDLTQGHSITANRAITWGDFAGEPTLNTAAQTLTNKTINGGTLDGAVLGGSIPVTLQGLNLDDLVAGDTIYASAADTFARLPKGANGEVLTLAAGIPSWAAGGSYSDAQAVLAVEAETNLELSTLVFINDTANGYATRGLTINQGTAGDQILALKSSNVAHGLTTGGYAYQETDTFLSIRKHTAGGSAYGGAQIAVYMEDAASTKVLEILATGGTASTDKTASGVGLINLKVTEHNGANGLSAVTADGNIFAIQMQGSTKFLVDEDGDTFTYGDAGYIAGSDPGSITDIAHVYAKDVSSSAEIFVRDEAGNVTQISPHDPDTNHWYFNSCNDFTGRCVQIDMEAALTALGALTGQTLITETFRPVEDRLDWDTVELGKQASAQRSIDAWNADPDPEGKAPDAYTLRGKPAWLTGGNAASGGTGAGGGPGRTPPDVGRP